MSHSRRVHALAAVAVGVSLLVAGCTQDAGPKPSPLPSPTKTASASAPTPPVMPAEAKGTSAESAKAFARYYVDLINYRIRSGDTDGLATLGDGDCKSCSGHREANR